MDYAEIIVAGHLKLFQTSSHAAEVSTYLYEIPVPGVHYLIKTFRRNVLM